MAKPLFEKDALDAAVKKMPDLPRNEVRVGAVVENGEGGVVIEGSKDIGDSGAYVAGEASWFTRMGHKAAVFVGWRK
jgi:hypothetical protein